MIKLKVDGLSYGIGEKTIIKDISLDIKKGNFCRFNRTKWKRKIHPFEKYL